MVEAAPQRDSYGISHPSDSATRLVQPNSTILQPAAQQEGSRLLEKWNKKAIQLIHEPW
jgi:hypothetical protein